MRSLSSFNQHYSSEICPRHCVCQPIFPFHCLRDCVPLGEHDSFLSSAFYMPDKVPVSWIANWVLIPSNWSERKCCDLHLTAEVIKRLSFSQVTQLVNARVRIWTSVWLQNSLAPWTSALCITRIGKSFSCLSQTKDQLRSHLSRFLWEAAWEKRVFSTVFISWKNKTMKQVGLHFFSGSK